MKVFSIRIPTVGPYAQMLNLWISRPYRTCARCGTPSYDPVHHVEVEWEPGSEQIGDFTFCIGAIVVKCQVADELLERFSGFDKGEVVMPDHPKLRRPERHRRRPQSRIWLPYQGPPVCEMRITKEVPFHRSSTVVLDYTCPECGVVRYKEFQGIEEKRGTKHVLREPGKGMFFDQSALEGADFFRPLHTGFNLCTQTARDFIVQKGYTNVEFLEVGNLFPI